MKNAVVANRYAKALYSLASEQKIEEKVLNELRETAKGFENSPEEFAQLISPTLSVDDRNKIVTSLFDGKTQTDLFKSFVQLLVSKDRLGLFQDIMEAYQTQSDLQHGVTRGVVRSPAALKPEERTRLEEIVSKVTNKKAILEYKQSPELIGGLLAKVGSYTFDDSLDTQLRLMYENLNRVQQ
jgi:F-type H+-transporting ATPase subunit delta